MGEFPVAANLREDGPSGESLLVVGARDVKARVNMSLALDAARHAAVAATATDTRVGRLTLPMEGGWMRIMGAVVPGLGLFGYKEFHLSGGDVRYQVHLFSIEDGHPIGLVDGSHLTPLRTAATAATAAVACLGTDTGPLTAALLGSGAEARAGLRALDAALPVSRARVFSRREENRRRFATEMADELGMEVEATAGTDSLVEGADLLYVATNSNGQVVIDDASLGPVPLVLSIGSTIPRQRELAADVLASAGSLVVDTPEVLEESGDAIAAIEAGLDPTGVVRLGDLLRAPDRPLPRRIVYKSIGSPEQDVVLAAAILERAEQEGFGTRLPPLSTVKRNL